MPNKVKLDPLVSNVSGKNQGPIPDGWGINHENAQFLDAMAKLKGWDDWNHAFREVAIEYLCGLDEDDQMNIGSHLDQSSTILDGLVRRLEIKAETNEQLAEETRAMLEDLQTVHEE